MRYMRCRCGTTECWTSMGSPACQSCDMCGTTLAEGPDGHHDPDPHMWRERFVIDKKTDQPIKVRECVSCLKRELVAATSDSEAGSNG